MANIAAAAGGVDASPANLRLTPETYTTLESLLEQNKDFVMPELVKTYGDQGITGFLKLTGAMQAGGTNDEVHYFEEGRRHRKVSVTQTKSKSVDQCTIVWSALGTDGCPFGANDVLMDSDDGRRYIVLSLNSADPTAATEAGVASLDGVAAVADATSTRDWIVLGNLYGQGQEQPSHFTDVDAVKRKNPFMIVKDRFQVNGSQATNIGWVDIGGGEYRWYMKGEQDARKRFEDRREMMMLFAETGIAADVITNVGAHAVNAGVETGPGSEGYVSAVESRGIIVSGANANPLDSFAEFDDIIMELDKNGAPSEYAMYVNRKQDLAIDDMLAGGIATQVTAGLAGQFGAFNNDADMAVNLGFKSFSRGGYTFHKHDWKLLNDPTLLGASNYLQGAMIPMSQVADARTGIKSPALAMYHKEAGGYSRDMEHWVTGGGVMGHANNGDAGRDVATFHYRSEVALVTRAANQHVLIKG
tara:strand:- start:4073 stop:5491 length:1419 start_codon:yes stop_codon:yes gene_type:complete